MKSNYAALLRDPRWQRKRLEIMSRDCFQCVECGDSKSFLNVHHFDYWPGVDPWEYPDNWLSTLCESCHSEKTEISRAKRERYGPLHARVFTLLSAIGPEPAYRMLLQVGGRERTVKSSVIAEAIADACIDGTIERLLWPDDFKRSRRRQKP